MKVCAYYKLDPFKEDKSPEQWIYMYLAMTMVEYEDLLNVKKPLAELSGEIAGGFFNPEGLKKYYEEKQRTLMVKDKKGVLKTGSGGGTAVSNVRFKDGKIVDDKGQEVMRMEELAKFLQKQSNLL